MVDLELYLVRALKYSVGGCTVPGCHDRQMLSLASQLSNSATHFSISVAKEGVLSWSIDAKSLHGDTF